MFGQMRHSSGVRAFLGRFLRSSKWCGHFIGSLSSRHFEVFTETPSRSFECEILRFTSVRQWGQAW